MTTVAFALVLASALCHATWNLLLKRSGDKVSFMACQGGVGALLSLVPAMVVVIADGLGWAGLAFGVVTAALHAVYGFSLARGYQVGDLSAVYPVSRGTGLALVPVLAIGLLNESVSALAWIGIACVAAGVYAIHLDPHALRDFLAPLRSIGAPAGRAALATGVLIACYSLWDKRALDEMSPLTLNQFAMAGHLFVLLPLFLSDRGQRVRTEWQSNRSTIVVSGTLVALAYLLVLAALTTSQVSYVAPAREVGIVFGALYGVLLLQETAGGTRVAAASLIVAGVLLLAVAP